MKSIYHEIPKIDISPVNVNSNTFELETLAREIYTIYSEIGFAYIVNHNVPQKTFDSIFEQSKLFHALPEDEKLKIKQNQFFRGYMPLEGSSFEISTLGKAKSPNLSTAFILAHDVSEDNSDYQNGINLAGPNQWPSEELLPSFKSTLLNYRNELSHLARKLVRIFSLALGQDFYEFDKYFKNPTTFLRLQYYPSCMHYNKEQQYGIAPHTDYGFLTLLVQDNIGGLQVLKKDGNWIDVEPLQGGIILNSGDMLRRISNNKIISTPHRVINKSQRERYSIPFFFEPDMHAMIRTIKDKRSQDNIVYPPIEYADYLMERIKGNYSINALDKNDII